MVAARRVWWPGERSGGAVSLLVGLLIGWDVATAVYMTWMWGDDPSPGR
jgi:hypothetical protein